MRVLGIDPGIEKLGWAVYNNRKKVKLEEKGLIRTGSKELWIKRYIYIKGEVERLLEKFEIQYIGSEAPIYHDYQSEALYALYILLQELFYNKKISVVYFAPNQLKFLAKELKVGAGSKMFKSDMIEAAQKDIVTWGLEVDKQLLKKKKKLCGDEADAYLAAKYGNRFFRYLKGNLGKKDLTESEKFSFTYIHEFKRGLKRGMRVKQGIVFKENELFFLFGNGEKRWKSF